MIIAVKKSKLNKLDTRVLSVVKISMEKLDKNEVTLPYLIPPASILIPRMNGDIGKKKFLKEYRKYLKESDAAQLMIFNILRALINKSPLCFTCTDSEYKLGYIQELVSYLQDEFDIDIFEMDDLKESIKDAISGLNKKEKKLLKSTKDLDKKTRRKRNKVIKSIKKSLIDYSAESIAYNESFKDLDDKFATIQLIEACVNDGIFQYNNDDIVDVDESKIGSKSIYKKAINKTRKSCKKYKKICDKAAKQYNIEITNKSLDKLSKRQLLLLTSEITKAIKTNIFKDIDDSDK